jgi:peptidoglycan/xylan/chitin deacetylase (PgdA/CDA1 family)
MKNVLGGLALVLACNAWAQASVEPRHRLAPAAGPGAPQVALTLDACGGRFDAGLIDLLVAHRIPATLFVTKKWLDQNPQGVAELLAHRDLFELEDHGSAHVPATVGPNRRIYGILGTRGLAEVQAEVEGGAQAVTQVSGRAPLYFRGATAVYDVAAIEKIEAMGYRIAGYSVNADSGATLKASAVAARLLKVKEGDVIIAHMNKPASGTASGFASALPRLLAQGFRFVKLSEARLQPI